MQLILRSAETEAQSKLWSQRNLRDIQGTTTKVTIMMRLHAWTLSHAAHRIHVYFAEMSHRKVERERVALMGIRVNRAAADQESHDGGKTVRHHTAAKGPRVRKMLCDKKAARAFQEFNGLSVGLISLTRLCSQLHHGLCDQVQTTAAFICVYRHRHVCELECGSVVATSELVVVAIVNGNTCYLTQVDLDRFARVEREQILVHVRNSIDVEKASQWWCTVSDSR